LGFVGVFFVLERSEMPSPAGKGDRGAVDEESRAQKPSGCKFSLMGKEKADTKKVI
jgi:hypothetical protein